MSTARPQREIGDLVDQKSLRKNVVAGSIGVLVHFPETRGISLINEQDLETSTVVLPVALRAVNDGTPRS